MTRTVHSQDCSFRINGKWWLPDTDVKIAGRLAYKQSKTSLSLYGGLTGAIAESPFSAHPDQREFPVVLGESEDNVPITLLRSYYTAWKPDITNLSARAGTHVALRSSKLHCTLVLEGTHLSSQEDTFATCRVEFPYLNVWLGASPFRTDSSDWRNRFVLEYVRPAKDEFKVDSLRFNFRFANSVTLPSLPLGASPTILHSSYIELAPFEPKPLKWFTRMLSEIADFFSVVYGGPLSSRRVTLYRSSRDNNPVSLYYPRHRIRVAKYDHHSFLINYDQIKASFQPILCEWLNASEDCRRARRMLVASESSPSKFMELRFLPLAHAVEVLSNTTEHSTIVEKGVFNDARRRMLESLDEDVTPELKESIKNCLGWANGRNLKRKLAGMLGDLDRDTCCLFAVDNEQFIKGIVNTRNHYTHYSTRAGQKILQDIELHWGIRKLSLMIRVILLMRAGVPEVLVRSLLRSHHRLSQERSVWREVSEEGSEYPEAQSESE